MGSTRICQVKSTGLERLKPESCRIEVTFSLDNPAQEPYPKNQALRANPDAMNSRRRISAFWTTFALAIQSLHIASAGLVLVPSDGAQNICPDTVMRLTFDAPPRLGRAGRIEIRNSAGELADSLDLELNDSHGAQARSIGGAKFTNYPVLISGNTAIICPHPGTLNYGQAYRVSVEAGVFATVTNQLGWTFNTRRSGPNTNATQVTVAADGSGDFCTVQGAVDFVPAGNTQPREIYIRNGVYEEIVYVTNKHHLSFRGEDRHRTVFDYTNNENFNHRGLAWNIYRQTFGVQADDFALENLTVRNATPRRGSQAEALRIDGERCVVRNVDFYSFQDTLKLSGTVFVSGCYIEGDVDFIWGYGTCYFTNCEIKCVTSGACVTQIRNDAAHFGDVFVDCRLTHAPGVTNAILSRIEVGRFPYSHVAWINCAMDDHIRPDAWRFTPGQNPPDNLRFWEYKTTGVSGGMLVDVTARAAISRQLTDEEATRMRDARHVLGGWAPE